MIVIVDYGAGNLVSVKKALDHLNHQCIITADPEQVRKAARIILPGVGNFAATAVLCRSGLEPVIEQAIGHGVPFLGICVGLQWMFEYSQESPETDGLGLFSGKCERFPSDVKSPHVGWNRIEIATSSLLFREIPSNSFVYFTHSFRAPLGEATVAWCEYGGKFSAAIERDRTFGVQFHPEKSGEVGLKVLANFCAL